MKSNAKDLLCSGRRDLLEMVAATIAVAQKPKMVKNMMRDLNLNHEKLTEYLEFLTNRHLIERSAKNTAILYQATRKGRRFLEIYCDILRLLYGEDFMQNTNNFAVACLRCCAETKSTEVQAHAK